MKKQIQDNIKKAEYYYFMYNKCMGLLSDLLDKDIFDRITSDYAISITPVGIFVDGEEITSEELQKFIEEKRSDYE